MIDTREFPKLIKHEEVETGMQLIVNGQVIPQTTTILVCPSCGSRLVDLGGKIMDVDMQKVFEHIPDDSLPSRCPICWQKLQYKVEVIDDESMDN